MCLTLTFDNFKNNVNKLQIEVLLMSFQTLSEGTAKQTFLLQLRINLTCVFKIFKIALVASRHGKFCETSENTREINP